MVLDYSKWDKLELSDDSDIEVHPNVDKKSFIKWKQRDIHEKREQAKFRQQQLEVNIETNNDLIIRINKLIDAAKDGFMVGKDINASVQVSAKGETKEKPALATSPQQPKYNDMIESMLVQITQEVSSEADIHKKLLEHQTMIENAIRDEKKELLELLEEKSRHISSEDIKDGWNSTIIYKDDKTGKVTIENQENKPAASSSGSTSEIEVINKATPASAPAPAASPRKNEDGLEELLAATKKFGEFPMGDFENTYKYLQQHPEIVNEGQKDALIMSAFDEELAGNTKATERVVFNSLLIQYSALLGKNGAATFYSRIMKEGHPARDAFYKEVEQTTNHIRSRCKVLSQEHEKEQEEEGVEQIQLHAVDPNTEIVIAVPEESSKGREIYDAFPQNIKDAIATRSLDEINKVLADLPIEDAEDLVGQFSESGVLLVEEKIYDVSEFQQKQAEVQAEVDAEAQAAHGDEEPVYSTIDDVD